MLDVPYNMPFKKLKQKAVQTPEGYKQSQITDFFRKSVSVVNRKLFIDGHSKPNMPIYKGKFIDINSDDEFDDYTKKVFLPFPLSSDDEETSNSNGSKNGKSRKKLLKKEKVLQSTSVKDKMSHPNENNLSTSTMIKLKNSLTSNASREVIPVASSTPLNIKTSFDENPILEDQSSEYRNVIVLNNTTLTPKRACKSTPANEQPFVKEKFSSPCKKSKMDISLSEAQYLKVPIDEGTSVAHITMTDDSLASPTKTIVFQISSSPSNESSKINEGKSPSRRTNGTPKQSKKAVTFNSAKLKPEEEDEKLNLTQVKLLKELFVEALENEKKKNLLTEADIEVIEEFLKMDIHNQYFLMKLFLYLPIWYNMNKFCSKIKLDQKLSTQEINTMYEYHKNSRFLYTDLSQLGTDELLDLLMIGDLRQIATTFKLNKKKLGTKPNIIHYLKENCKTQTILTISKSSEDLLKDAARKHLGYCIKLKEEVKCSFDKVYVLQTCSNFSYCKDIQNYLKDLGYAKVVYPSYLIENYTPFENKGQFSRFYEAIEIEKEFYRAIEKNNNVTLKNLCDETFKKLQSLDDDGKWKRHLYDYLQKFSAEYRYISVLNSAIKKYVNKLHFETVKIWIEFLIEHYPKHHATGLWYKQLAHIILHYYKKYDSAAEIILKAFKFNKKENIFDLLQIYELNKLSTKIRTTKSYKVCSLYCDQLALNESSIDANIFPKKLIKGCTYRRGTPGKRTYSYRDSNNEVTYGSVENITLRYYLDNEGYQGVHCEGKFIDILFTLFFWDIIYEYYVPRTFISKLQSAPLDMYSGSFYEHRKGEIHIRLDEITSEWSENKLESVLRDNWQNHSHEKSITDLEGLGKDLNDILIMFHCIERRVLSKILGRLVTNYRRYRSGLPDLFLWNAELLKCKFVEVKGENDSLQPNQILWIQHLIEVGAEVEVCHVSGVGAKKLMTRGENLNEELKQHNE